MTDSTRDTGQAAEPGTVSRLLVEIFKASELDLADSWREPLKAGDVVGRYQIRREIGRGGFGAVYEAFDTQLGRVVALKALKPGRSKHPVNEEWIQKEAEAVAKLDHPAIVTIHDVGTCPAGAYLVMELLRGETLARRIEKGPLPVDEALRIAEQMAEGLAHAHSRGVLHRDLKPANVFVCEDGRVKLLDFGLAHLLGYGGVERGRNAGVHGAGAGGGGERSTSGRTCGRRGWCSGRCSPGSGRWRGRRRRRGATRRTGRNSCGKPPAAAASPGTTLALGRVPRPVAKAVGAALSEDPAARPRDGGSWLSELRSARLGVERPRRLRRITAFAVLFLVLGLVVAGLATWRVWERQIPGGRPTVAVADFVNETGEKELDSVSGLLITSLEQGTQLRVLTRGRMVDVLKQLGKGAVERIDEPLAREVGKETRANALLLASIRKFGDAYVVEMRALDPLHDEYIFTVSDRATGKGAVFDLIDRLGEATRKRLGATDAAATPPPRVATITTTSPKAWELLVWSRDAATKDNLDESRRLALAALEQDPEFALAHYQLVYVEAWGIDLSKPIPDRARTYLEAAIAREARLPEKERLFLRAWRAMLEDRPGEVRAILDSLAETYPLDKEAVYLAGNNRIFNRLNWDTTGLDLIQRALQLDPSFYVARFDFLITVAEFGWGQRHVEQIRALMASATRREEFLYGGIALLDAGFDEEGTAALSTSTRMAGGRWPSTFIVRHLIRVGRPGEAESLVQTALASDEPLGPGQRGLYVSLIELHAARGRIAAAVAAIDEERRVATAQGPVKGSAPRPLFWLWKLPPWVASRTPQPILTELEERELPSPDGYPPAPILAIEALALAGDTPGAARLASSTRKRLGPAWKEAIHDKWKWDGRARRRDAIADIGDGLLDRAVAELRILTAGPYLTDRFWAAFLLGELARDRGDCGEAVRWLEQAASVPPYCGHLGFRIYSEPGMIQSLATCYEKLGDLTKARERNAEMLKRWEKADEDIPLLIEAKAMRDRLATAPGVASSPR